MAKPRRVKADVASACVVAGAPGPDEAPLRRGRRGDRGPAAGAAGALRAARGSLKPAGEDARAPKPEAA